VLLLRTTSRRNALASVEELRAALTLEVSAVVADEVLYGIR